MDTYHRLIIGNCMSMKEISDEKVHLIVASPPYFNAPFDYKGLFGVGRHDGHQLLRFGGLR